MSQARWHRGRGIELLSSAFHTLGLSLPRSAPATLLSIAYHWTRLRWRTGRQTARDQCDPATAKRIDALRRASDALTRIDGLAGLEVGLRGTLLELDAGTRRDAAVAWARIVLYTAILNKDESAVGRAVQRAESFVDASSDLEVRTYLRLFRGIANSVGYLAIAPERSQVDLTEAEEGLARQALAGATHQRDLVRWLRAVNQMNMGQLAPLAAELPAQLDDVWNRGDLCMLPLWSGLVSPLVNLAKGQDALVEHNLDRAHAAWKGGPHTLQSLHLGGGTLRLLLYRKRMREAWEYAQGSYAQFRKSPSSRSIWGDEARLLRALCAGGLAAELPRGRSRGDLLDVVASTITEVRHPLMRLLLLASHQLQSGKLDAAIASLRGVDAFPRERLMTRTIRQRLLALTGERDGESEAFWARAGVVDIDHYTRALLPSLHTR